MAANDENQQMIQERRLKIDEIIKTQRISTESVQALRETIEGRLNQLRGELKIQQEGAERRTRESIQQQISELNEPSGSEDQLVQQFRAYCRNIARPPLDDGTVVRAVSQLEETLTEFMKETRMKLIKKFAVDVTLDPATTHPKLNILSDDGKQVSDGGVEKKLPDNPERFTQWLNVLGKQSFTSGRFYFEVQVKGKTGWSVGVAKESANRKVQDSLSPQCGFWKINLQKLVYTASDDPDVLLCVRSLYQKVGVFVDYEEGLL